MQEEGSFHSVLKNGMHSSLKRQAPRDTFPPDPKQNLPKSLKSAFTGLSSMMKSALHPQLPGLAKGVESLNDNAITFDASKEAGYNYKNWEPQFIPFIQASSDIYETDADGRLPMSIVVPAGSKKDFQIILPREHPFLLIDIRATATKILENEESSGGTLNGSRFSSPFDDYMVVPDHLPLFRKYLFPGAENVIVAMTAISPKGRPIMGGLQNVSGMLNNVATVGAEAHTEYVPLYGMQQTKSGKGSLQYHLLFPENGIIRFSIINNEDVPIDCNGCVFGYVILR